MASVLQPYGHRHTSSQSSSASAPISSSRPTNSYTSSKPPSSFKGNTTPVASYSGTSSGVYPVASYDQAQVTSGKLHKRSQSAQPSITTRPSAQEDDAFSIEATHHKKGRIKPILQRVSGANSGKLDLGKPDGGAGGMYYTSSSPYIGGRASATDLNSFVPTHRQVHHKRTISGTSSTHSTSSPNFHPRRHAPTPDNSYPNSVGGNESDESDESDMVTSLPKPSPIRSPLSAQSSPLAFPPRLPSTSDLIAPTSPIISPLVRSGTLDSFTTKKQKVYGGRVSSEEYAESVLAARAQFDQRQAKKDEKEERKIRKSVNKDRDREKVSLDDSAAGSQNSRSRWMMGRHSTPNLPITSEKTIGVPYNSDLHPASASQIDVRNVVMKGAERERRNTTGVKQQWMGFVVWVRIGMVKLGRKVRTLF